MNDNSYIEVLNEWNRSQARSVQLRKADLVWNLESQDLVEYSVQKFAGVSTIVAIASVRGVLAGLSATNLWISIWGEVPSGDETNFVKDAMTHATRLGKTRLTLGGDEFHFISGIPFEGNGNLRLIEAVRGLSFEGGEVADYQGLLQTPPVTDYISEALAQAKARALSFSAPASETENNELNAYLSREFPGRWHREFQFWRSRKDTSRAFWFTLRGENQAIIGFARMAVRGRLQPIDQGWTPGALRLPHVEGPETSNDNACLGPIGVSKNQRGQGTGRVLLGLVLNTLKTQEARSVCIDWTNAFKYYEPLHFLMARRYWSAWKDLG